jgi:hypothetical protein
VADPAFGAVGIGGRQAAPGGERVTNRTFQLICLLPWWDPDTVTVALRGPQTEDDAPVLVVRSGFDASPTMFRLADDEDGDA